MAVGHGPADIVGQLRLPADAELVHIKRLRTVDDEPVFLSDAYIPASVLPNVASDDLTTSGLDQSLYRLIERHHPVPLADGEEVATAVIANEEVRGIFELPQHSPVIRNTCLLRDRNGSPIIYEEATWGVPQRSTVIWRRSFAAT
jgi:DNA-binding GntR family transcriptional regulator